MSTTEVGRKAEKTAAKHLKKQGYKILAQNWRTRWCEIDIVAIKNSVIYFVEVKYRAKNDWGDGLEVITAKKLKQMEFAAQNWVNDNGWSKDYRLAVVNMDGSPPKLVDFIEL